MKNRKYLKQSPIQVLEEEAYNHIGARIDYSSYIRKEGYSCSEFQADGYFCLEMAVSAAEIILSEFFDESLICKFTEDDCIEGYRPTIHSKKTLRLLNDQHIYFRPPGKRGVMELQRYIDSIQSEVSSQIGTNWKVTNVRAWKTKSIGCDGPSGWHFDGFSRFQRKLLIYPVPPNNRNGTVEIADRSGNIMTLEYDVPVCVLYDPAVLLHRGRPGVGVNRPIIEITIFPSSEADSTLIFAGQNARAPIIKNSSLLDELAVNQYKPPLMRKSRIVTQFRHIKGGLSRVKNLLLRSEPMASGLKQESVFNIAKYLNIGGGPLFKQPGWINLDSAPSENNRNPFLFSEDCVFPIPTGTLHLVYSSHCFEHLSDDTVAQILKEVRRVLRRDGELVIKIPNYRLVKEALENRDSTFFDKWDLDSIVTTWATNGVTDSLENRASMIYCGYWNRQYGDHFSGADRGGHCAYHGPAKVNDDALSVILGCKSDHQIASQLRSIVLESGDVQGLNHQNAWSEEEFISLLHFHNFKVISIDSKKIETQFMWIPGISHMSEISSYYMCTVG